MKAQACPAAAGPLRPANERASYDCNCLGTAPVQLLVDVSVNPNAQTLSLPSPVVVDEAEAEARTANERDAHSNGCDGIEINCRRWAEERRMFASLSSPFVVARATCGVALGPLWMVSRRRPSLSVSLFSHRLMSPTSLDYIRSLHGFAETQMGASENTPDPADSAAPAGSSDSSL